MKTMEIDYDFHPVLKDVGNLYTFFLLAVQTLSQPAVQNIIKTAGDPTMLHMLEKFITSTGYESDGSKSTLYIKNYLVFLNRAIAVMTYDFLKKSEYYNDIKKTEEFVFLRFIRNGAAHSNKFNLKDEHDEWKLAEDDVIKWSNKEITRRLHLTTVFNDFLTIGQLIFLAKDFSEKLYEIDKNKK